MDEIFAELVYQVVHSLIDFEQAKQVSGKRHQHFRLRLEQGRNGSDLYNFVINEQFFSVQCPRMKFVTCLAALMCNLIVIICLYRPWPLTSLLEHLSLPQQLLVIAGFLGAAILLLWSSAPRPRVDPSGKAVFITGKFYFFAFRSS